MAQFPAMINQISFLLTHASRMSTRQLIFSRLHNDDGREATVASGSCCGLFPVPELSEEAVVFQDSRMPEMLTPETLTPEMLTNDGWKNIGEFFAACYSKLLVAGQKDTRKQLNDVFRLMACMFPKVMAPCSVEDTMWFLGLPVSVDNKPDEQAKVFVHMQKDFFHKVLALPEWHRWYNSVQEHCASSAMPSGLVCISLLIADYMERKRATLRCSRFS